MVFSFLVFLSVPLLVAVSSFVAAGVGMGATALALLLLSFVRSEDVDDDWYYSSVSHYFPNTAGICCFLSGTVGFCALFFSFTAHAFVFYGLSIWAGILCLTSEDLLLSIFEQTDEK